MGGLKDLEPYINQGVCPRLTHPPSDGWVQGADQTYDLEG